MRILFFLFSAVLFLRCSSDDNDLPAKELYLSKVSKNSFLQYEYLYDVNKKPFRRNHYNENLGQNSLLGFRLYDYNDAGLLTKVTNFNKDGQNQGNSTLTYNTNGLISRLDSYSSTNTLMSYYVFEYSSNILQVANVFMGASNKKSAEVIFSYDNENNISKIIRKGGFSTGNTYQLDSSIFNIPRTFPAHWNYYEMLPVIALPYSDEMFFDMIAESRFNYLNGAPPFIYDNTFANKQFDADGYLQKQSMNIRNDNGLTIYEGTDEMTYEYLPL